MVSSYPAHSFANSVKVFFAHISNCLKISAVYLTSVGQAFCLQGLDLVDQELLFGIELFVAVSSDALKLSKEFRVRRFWGRHLSDLMVQGR